MKLPDQLTKQTKESKYLSFILFITLPVLAGFLVYVNMKEIWDHKLLRNIARPTDLRQVPLQNNAAYSINELTEKDLLMSDSNPEMQIFAYGRGPETRKNNAKTGMYSVILKSSNSDKLLITDRPFFGTPDKIFDIYDNQIYVINSSRNAIDIYNSEMIFIESIPVDSKIDEVLYGIECGENACTLYTGVDYDAGCTYELKTFSKEVEQIDCFYAM